MRIGIDAGRALHGEGGVAAYTRELIAGLVRHAPAEEVVLVDLDRGRRGRAEYERSLGPLPPAVEIAPAERRVLAGLDLFHAPGFAMPPGGAPHHLLTLHDLTVLSHPECHTPANRARTVVAVAAALARGATVLAVSQATRSEAVRLLALAPERVEVLPPLLAPCFDAGGDAEADAGARRRLGVAAPYVLAVASLEPRKNLERLLDAWQLLPAPPRAAHRLVLVASTGWLAGRLRRRLAGLARAGQVIVLGRLAARDLAALYRGARALAFPSLAEGFGLPVAEAMACGAPVITSNRSSMPETAGGAAVLVEPEDTDEISAAIARVVGDAELRRDLRARGFERAQHFAPAAVVPQLLAVYRRASGRLG